MEFTQAQLSQILTSNRYILQWYEALTKLLPQYNIDTPQRLAAFLAQCKHESGGFNAIKENLNYRAESLMRTWPKRFPTMEIAQQYAHNQEAIANRAYADRMGNGNEASGDGWRYCGRGLIQLTGKNNYADFAESLDMNVEDVPAYLETFEGAVQSACFFWEKNNLNDYADNEDIVGMTKIINGGTLGLQERIDNYEEIKQIIGA